MTASIYSFEQFLTDKVTGHLNDRRNSKFYDLYKPIQLPNLKPFARSNDIGEDTVLRVAWGLVLSKHFESSGILFGILEQNEIEPVPFSVDTSKTAISHALQTAQTFKSAHARAEHMETVTPECALPSLLCSLDCNTQSIPLVEGKTEMILIPRRTSDDGFEISARFAAQFDETFIRVFLTHFTTVLGCIVGLREESLSTRLLAAIDIMPEAEVASLLDEGRPRVRREDLDLGSIHQRFRRQAQQTPNAIAMEDDTQQMISYADLNDRSDQFSLAIQASLTAHNAQPLYPGRGISEAVVVLLCMKASINLIVAILGTWKAGAAVTVLDPDGPTTRNNIIATTVRSPFMIVHGQHAQTFIDIPILEYTQLMGSITSNKDLDPSTGTSEFEMFQYFNTLAWVGYTSGSTGIPKCVPHSHASMAPSLCAFERKDQRRTLLFLNPTFTASHRSLWPYLMTGGCVCIANRKDMLLDLGSYLNKFKVDELSITPSALALVLPDDVPTLKQVTLTGELASKELLNRWIKKVKLDLSYGCTELGAFHWGQKSDHRPSFDTVNGFPRPQDTKSSYVLEKRTDKLAPRLVVGDLCFAETWMPAGYLNDPAKTQLVFQINPFAKLDGNAYLYRTGDCAFITADGRIQIQGRVDSQIKIDGNRVNLEEVQFVLSQHSQIKAVKAMSGSLPNRTIIVACVVLISQDLTASHHQEEEHRWRTVIAESTELIKEKLPNYMIPSKWIRLDHLSVTHSGKADLSELESVVQQSLVVATHQNDSSEQNASHKEQMFYESCKTFNEMVINPDISFLENGGTSLTAILLTNKIRKLGWRLTIEDLLNAKSLRDAVGVMTEFTTKTRENAEYGLLDRDSLPESLQQDPNIKAVYPTTPLQDEMVAISLVRPSAYVVYRFYDLSDFLPQEIFKIVQEVTAKISIFRTLFVRRSSVKSPFFYDTTCPSQYQKNQETFLQVEMKTIPLLFEESGESKNPAEYYALDILRPWILGRPYIRLSLLKSGILAVTFNHAIMDQWCSNFFNTELHAAFTRLRSGLNTGANTPNEIQRPPLYYFIHHALEKANSPELPAGVMWNQYLADAVPTFLDLPRRAPRQIGIEPPPRTGHLVEMDLKSVCKAQNISSGSLFHTAWAFVLAKMNRCPIVDEVTFYTIVGGRDAIIDASLINGQLISISPLRIVLSPDMTLTKLVQTTLKQMWSVSGSSPCYMEDWEISSGEGSVDLPYRRRRYGDTLINHVTTGQHEEASSFPDCGPSTTYSEQIHAFEPEIDVIELDGGKIQYWLYSNIIPEVEAEILQMMEYMVNTIALHGTRLTVKDILNGQLVKSDHGLKGTS